MRVNVHLKKFYEAFGKISKTIFLKNGWSGHPIPPWVRHWREWDLPLLFISGVYQKVYPRVFIVDGFHPRLYHSTYRGNGGVTPPPHMDQNVSFRINYGLNCVCQRASSAFAPHSHFIKRCHGPTRQREVHPKHSKKREFAARSKYLPRIFWDPLYKPLSKNECS